MTQVIKLILLIALLVPSVSSLAVDTITRAVFTTKIKDREPVDRIDQLSNNKTTVYFFTDIRGMKGQTITHRWVHDDSIQAEVSFDVGGNRWRVWSSKQLQTDLLGRWIVTVINDQGKTLTEESMVYMPGKSDNAAAAPTTQSLEDKTNQSTDSAQNAQ